jgi:excisionase family DNA binding protein
MANTASKEERTTVRKPAIVVSLNEAAATFGVSPGLLRLEIARGRLKAIRIGRRLLIPVTEIERRLEGAE